MRLALASPPMSESLWSNLLCPDLADLAAYTTAEGPFDVRLDANECPSVFAPEALAELGRAMTVSSPNRYPDGRVTELRRAIADRCGAHPDEVVVGTGSDEVIAMILTALNQPQGSSLVPTVMIPTPTFVMYKQSARARGFKVIDVPLDPAYDLDVGAMIRGIEFARPNVVFVASPNSPTSTLMSSDRLATVIEAAKDALVVVDEALHRLSPRSNSSFAPATPTWPSSARSRRSASPRCAWAGCSGLPRSCMKSTRCASPTTCPCHPNRARPLSCVPWARSSIASAI